MKIAFVTDYPSAPDRVTGGVEAVVVRIATAMAARPGIEVHAVSFDRGVRAPVREELRGVQVHRFPATGRLGNLTLGRQERRMTARALGAIAPDVAHVHWLGPPALGTADSGVPWVATAHGMQWAEGKTMPGLVNRVRAHTYATMERMSLRQMKHMIVISPYVLDYFGDRLDGVETHPIENPVADHFFEADGPGDPRTVLFTGRLIPRKDVETLLDAAGRLASDGCDFRLRIAGGADDLAYETELKERARRHNVEACVDFLGVIRSSELVREVAGAGMLAMSSRQETASVSIMEAMAGGLPIVATDVGGTRWLVEDGASGTLVPVGDDVRLAEALRRYLEDPSIAREHGREARRIAERRFRLDAVVDRTLEVYSRVIAGGPGAENPLDRDRVIA